MTAAIALAVSVNAPPDRITEALSTAEGLASFWPPTAAPSRKPGRSRASGSAGRNSSCA